MGMLPMRHGEKAVGQLIGEIPEKSAMAENIEKRPDPEVAEKPKRRRFASAYKLKVLDDVDRCTDQGGIGSLLRREGLYYSYLGTWRQQRDIGQLTGLSPQKRGRKANLINPLSDQVEKLERENACLRHELEKAVAIIEVQKKISTLLGISLTKVGNEESRL